MRKTRSFHGLIALALLAAIPLATGCKPKKYTVSTRIDPTGEFDREILQPLDDSLPPEALAQPKAGPSSPPTADLAIKPSWRREWRQCTTRPAEPPAEGTCVVASGHFAVADQIPRNYHLIAYPFPDRASSNQIAHAFDDCLLFGVDSWTETLTETVSLPDYVEAVDEMLNETLPAVKTALDEVLGREYDLTALQDYLDKDLRKTVRRLYLWCYQHGPGIDADGLCGFPVRELRLILVGAGFTLPVTNETEPAVDPNRLAEAWEPFLRERLRKLVRMKEPATPLTDEQVRDLMDRFGLFTESRDPGATAPATRPGARDQEAMRLAFLRHFERLNKIPYEQASARWEARIGGAHRINPLTQTSMHELTGSRHYAYSFAAGGPILETNGRRVAEDQVRWEFTDLDIWPHGYAMQVTALRWNRQAEKRLFGRIVMRDLDTVLHLRDLIADHDPVYNALAQAIEQGDLHPIKALAESKEPANREAAKTILDLKTRR